MLHIDLEALNVDQGLDLIKSLLRKKEIRTKESYVELAKDLAVQGLTLDVLLKPQFVQSSGIASVLFTDQVDHNADQDLKHSNVEI